MSSVAVHRFAAVASIERAAVGVGAVAVGVAAGAAGAGLATTAAVVLLSGILFGLVLASPRLCTVLAVMSAFSLSWATSLGYVDSSAKVMQDVLSVALVSALLLRVARNRSSVRWPPGIAWLITFIAGGAISAIAGAENVTTALLALRELWKYIPLFVVPTALVWSGAFRRKLVWLLIAMCVAQVPVAFVQFMTKTTRSGDTVGGTLGDFSSGALTGLCIAVGGLLIGLIVYRAVPRYLVVAAFGVICIPPALDETKIFFIAAPLVWGLRLITRVRRRGLVAIAMLMVCMVGVSLVAVGYDAYFGRNRQVDVVVHTAIQEQLDPALGEGRTVRRLHQPSVAIEYAWTHPLTIPLGSGLGSLKSTGTFETQGVLVRALGGEMADAVFAVRLFLEQGVIGVVALVGLLLAIVLTSRKVERATVEPFWRAVAMGTQGFVLVMAVWSLYSGAFVTDALACSFWLVAGLVAAESTSLNDSRPAS